MIVISIGQIHGGKAFNVIPDSVTLDGTIRLHDMSLYEDLFATLTKRVEEIASAYGCTAKVIDRDGEVNTNSRGEKFTLRAFPVNVNNDMILNFGITTASKLFGKDMSEIKTKPSTACEDFAFISEQIPSSSFSLGTKSPNHQKGEHTGTAVHNPLFDIDERALPRGSAFLSTYALEYIQKRKYFTIMSKSSKKKSAKSKEEL